MMDKEKLITYDKMLSKIKNTLDKTTLSNDDRYLLTLFATDLCHRQVLYNNDLTDKNMQNELQNAISLLQSTHNNTETMKYLMNIYNKFYIDEVQNNHSQSQSNTNANTQTREKVLVRVRTDGIHHSSGGTDDESNYMPNSNSGFSNIIFILIMAVVGGLGLALLLIKILGA